MKNRGRTKKRFQDQIWEIFVSFFDLFEVKSGQQAVPERDRLFRWKMFVEKWIPKRKSQTPERDQGPELDSTIIENELFGPHLVLGGLGGNNQICQKSIARYLNMLLGQRPGEFLKGSLKFSKVLNTKFHQHLRSYMSVFFPHSFFQRTSWT